MLVVAEAEPDPATLLPWSLIFRLPLSETREMLPIQPWNSLSQCGPYELDFIEPTAFRHPPGPCRPATRFAWVETVVRDPS